MSFLEDLELFGIPNTAYWTSELFGIPDVSIVSDSSNQSLGLSDFNVYYYPPSPSPSPLNLPLETLPVNALPKPVKIAPNHWICPCCEKKFTRSFNCTSHIKVNHTDLPKSHKCSFCNFGFARKSDLIRHNRDKHGVKQVKCQECNVVFGRNVTASKHVCKLL